MRVLRQLLSSLSDCIRSRAPGNGCTEATGKSTAATTPNASRSSYGMNSRGTNALFKRRRLQSGGPDVAGDS